MGKPLPFALGEAPEPAEPIVDPKPEQDESDEGKSDEGKAKGKAPAKK